VVTDGLRQYRYVGPADTLAGVRSDSEGHVIGTPDDFVAWLKTCSRTDLEEPFTFVVDLTGTLRLAPRRSEHVACAGGARVLSAGEITFVDEPDGWAVSEVSNQSTGYCPEVSSWPAVEDALDRAGLIHPDHFNYEFVFRRCPRCQERNVVRDDYFACAICDSELPDSWNFDPLNEREG
jgi:hypothetical protein